jgi:hypothetical protein
MIYLIMIASRTGPTKGTLGKKPMLAQEPSYPVRRYPQSACIAQFEISRRSDNYALAQILSSLNEHLLHLRRRLVLDGGQYMQ